jgi:hypothetical protein
MRTRNLILTGGMSMRTLGLGLLVFVLSFPLWLH